MTLEQKKRFVVCKVCGNVYEAHFYTKQKCVRFLACEQMPSNLILIRQALNLLRGKQRVRLVATETGGLADLNDEEIKRRMPSDYQSSFLVNKTIPLEQAIENLDVSPMIPLKLPFD